MAALTQFRPWGPYTGSRYDFVTPPPIVVNIPDFMHGELSVRPYDSGNLTVAHISGDIWADVLLPGRIQVNP